jgi:transketolase
LEIYDGEFISELETIARRVRAHAVTMIYRAGSGHPGGSLSAVDILVALYFHLMKHDPKRPDWVERGTALRRSTRSSRRRATSP